MPKLVFFAASAFTPYFFQPSIIPTGKEGEKEREKERERELVRREKEREREKKKKKSLGPLKVRNEAG